MKWMMFTIFEILFVVKSLGSIVLSEINFNPTVATCANDDCEYLEIFNNGSSSIDISGWDINDSNAPASPVFTFPVSTIIGSGEYIVITKNISAFNSAYPGFSGQLFGGAPSLNNGGDYLEIRDGSNGLIDSYTYSGTGPGNNDGNTLTLTESGWVGASPSPGTGDLLLPVSLLSFDATSNSDQIQLTWATATEVNNAGFQIERSVEGTQWSPVAFIPGIGHSVSVHQYEYLDQPGSAGLYYYRLKQVDIDGQYSYSSIRQVRLLPTGEAWLVRNTLVHDHLTLNLGSGHQGMSLRLYNLSGQQIMSWTLPAGVTETDLNLAGLDAGLYVLRSVGATGGAWKIIKY